MDSSSVAAAECVSRSESLLRQVRTRCLKSGGDLGVCLLGVCLASDIVEVTEVVYSDVTVVVVVACL
ncbi:hypothetical protein HanXRQr2_Chr08g0355671 [Helianthus annuus]|uniref:Uncharacterized protein n=1 Tax=Helianthus annuus TaxID=4232 RepID=A0A9K3IGT7_HELAN|nr:hypothetical protein HanXRQr2_Chr08g0355671 [Helianthus annuus]KAJ0902960.1 hypothetical protein HanPSC8_Chr08g0343451 [Helianthus annuus]